MTEELSRYAAGKAAGHALIKANIHRSIKSSVIPIFIYVTQADTMKDRQQENRTVKMNLVIFFSSICILSRCF